ncbi:MAG: Phenylalanine-tRNA ligase alpha subunit, partial [Candidatus Peribacteria bacterium GW2011_GWB1_54_5]
MAATSSSWAEFMEQIEKAQSAAALSVIEQRLFGRKDGAMTLAMKELKELDESARKKKAMELNEKKKKLIDAIENRKATLASPQDATLRKEDALDVTLRLPRKEQGHLHLIPEFYAEVEEIFGRMGFDVMESPEMETEDLNFTQLNIPEDHPARDTQDTFWMKMKGKEKKVLRTHTSPGQVRYMRSHKPPFRAIFPGKVYRKDADATHSPMFHQFEGMLVDKNVAISNLKGTLDYFAQKFFGKERKSRLRPHHFRFTEPSFEVDVTCGIC